MTDFGRLRVAAIRNEDAESKNTRKRPDRTRIPDRSPVANNSGPFQYSIIAEPSGSNATLLSDPIASFSLHCKHVDLECSAVLYRMYCTPLPLLCPPFGSNRFGRDASAAEATPPAPLMSSGCSLSLSLSLSVRCSLHWPILCSIGRRRRQLRQTRATRPPLSRAADRCLI